MKKVYLITYDITKTDKDYSGLEKAIKEYTGWWHYMKSIWLVATEELPNQIGSKIRPHIDEVDNLLIIEVTKSYSGWLSKKAWEWMEANISKT